MEQNNPFRVFLTTLSKLERRSASYYFFRYGENDRRYYTGDFTSVPAAKHVLSNYSIDRIVMLGSDQTCSEGDLNRDTHTLSEGDNANKAFPYLKRTLTEYLCKKGSDETPETPIPKVGGADAFSVQEAAALRQKIGDLLKEKLPQTPEDEWFDAVARDSSGKESLTKQIDDEIQKYFKQAYLTPEDAESTIEKLKQQALPSLSVPDVELSDGDRTFLQSLPAMDEGSFDTGLYEVISSEMDKLKENRAITLFGRQIFLSVRYQEVRGILRRIRTAGREKDAADAEWLCREIAYYRQAAQDAAARTEGIQEQIKMLQGDAEQLRIGSEELLEKYRELVEKLQKELSDIRTNRINLAKAYIRQLLFDRMDPNLKAKPNASNKPDEMPVQFIGFMDDEPDATSKAIKDVVDAIRKDVPDGMPIALYIDMQGGVRTNAFILNSVLSILNNDEKDSIRIEGAFATNWMRDNFASEIVDETSRYRISDLVSGMNAFLRYGKADQIAAYAKGQKLDENKPIRKLIDAMQSLDRAVSLCSPYALKESIKELKAALKTVKTAKKQKIDWLFDLLTDGIRRDYGRLIELDQNDDSLYIELIRWCFRKKLYQQALTIIETYLPELLVRQRFLYYEDPNSGLPENQKDRGRGLAKYMKNGDTSINLIKAAYGTEEYYFLKNFVHVKCNYYNSAPRQTPDSERKAKFFFYYLSVGSRQSIIRAYDEHGNTIEINDISIRSCFDRRQDTTKTLQELLSDYYTICSYRNEINHGGKGRRSFDSQDIEKIINRIITNWNDLVEAKQNLNPGS